MKRAGLFCESDRSMSPQVIVASSGQHITPAQEPQMPGQNTQPDSATLRQESPVAMVATNTLAALLTEPTSDLQKRREAYKRAQARRRDLSSLSAAARNRINDRIAEIEEARAEGARRSHDGWVR